MNFKVKLVLFILYLLFFPVSVLSASEQPIDLRVVVDISGEVRKAVPNKEHLDAIQLLVNQLPSGSKAGVWTYGKYVNHLVKHGRITQQWLNEANISIKKIRSVASRRDIYSALKKSSFDIGKKSAYQRHILLLSSGAINISDEQESNNTSHDYLLTDLLPKLFKSGISVHTVSLTENAGVNLLRSISKETQGFSFVTAEPNKIADFTNTFASVFNRQNYIPIHEKQFAIDANVKEFTATLFGPMAEAFSVTSPSGKVFSRKNTNGHWLQGKAFSQFKLTDPELGQWKIIGDITQSSRVYIRGGEVLEVDGLKQAYITSENIPVSATAKLMAGGALKKVAANDAEFLVTVRGLEGVNKTSTQGATSRENFSQNMSASNGNTEVFETEIQGLSQKGLYALSTIVKALDYERAIDNLLQVNELFKIDVSTDQQNELLVYNIKIIPVDPSLDLAKTNVIATVTDSAGEWNVQTVESIGSEGWRLALKDDNKSTEYKVELDFKGVTISDRQIHYRPKPLIIELPNSPKSVVEEKVEIHAQEKVDPPIVEQIQKPSVNTKLPDQNETKAETEKPAILILIAGICFIISSALILLYFWRPSKKSKPNTASEIEPEKGVTEKQKEPVTVSKEVEEITSDSAELAGSDTKEEVSVDSGKVAEQIEAELPLEIATEEIETIKQTVQDEEHEVALDFEDDLTEETELASEWQDFDAESNLPSSSGDEIDVEFDFDEPTNSEDDIEVDFDLDDLNEPENKNK